MDCDSLPAARARHGFTLVELMIVMLVVAILATMVIGAYTSSMELGKEARTRSQIAKINALIAADWEKYRTRRVKLTGVTGRKQIAEQRLSVLREIMRAEFPDRKADVLNTLDVNDLPARAQWYREEAKRLTGGDGSGWTETYQQAECLYLIVASSQDRNTNGLEFFRQTEIGDKDGDKMNELLDGWGNPIRFLRWAPGFISDKQQAYREVSQSRSGGSVVVNLALNDTWAEENPDPFDPLRVDANNPVTFYLYPLVISAGGDGIFDIRFSTEGSRDDQNPYFGVKTGTDSSTSGAPLGKYQDQGELLGDNATPNGQRNDDDNIHNHFVSVKVR